MTIVSYTVEWRERSLEALADKIVGCRSLKELGILLLNDPA